MARLAGVTDKTIAAHRGAEYSAPDRVSRETVRRAVADTDVSPDPKPIRGADGKSYPRVVREVTAEIIEAQPVIERRAKTGLISEDVAEDHFTPIADHAPHKSTPQIRPYRGTGAPGKVSDFHATPEVR